MINIYESIQNKDGSNIDGRTKLFIQKADEQGEITLCNYGTLYTPSGTGAMYIVDDWLIDQLDKVQFIDGILSVKDGERLIPTVKTEKELQREVLLKQLDELDSQPSE